MKITINKLMLLLLLFLSNSFSSAQKKINPINILWPLGVAAIIFFLKKGANGSIDKKGFIPSIDKRGLKQKLLLLYVKLIAVKTIQETTESSKLEKNIYSAAELSGLILKNASYLLQFNGKDLYEKLYSSGIAAALASFFTYIVEQKISKYQNDFIFDLMSFKEIFNYIGSKVFFYTYLHSTNNIPVNKENKKINFSNFMLENYQKIEKIKTKEFPQKDFLQSKYLFNTIKSVIDLMLLYFTNKKRPIS